jgi:hypothetical protein
MKKIYSKNILMTAVLAVILGIGMLFTACEGPAGPAGKDGTNGKDGANGVNGTAVCKACHSNTATDVNLKFAQYDLSKHNTGVIFEEEAGRIACGGCHTGMGFAEAASLGKDDPTTMATGKITCTTCHTIHSNYDSTDFGFRIKAGFALRQSALAVDFKDGNTCAKCHQARSYAHTNNEYDSVNASATTTYSRFGPHYGVVANVASMNAANMAGLEAVPGFIAQANPHSAIADGCVDCHMVTIPNNPGAGGHTFGLAAGNYTNPLVNLAASKEFKTGTPACSGCHPDSLTFVKGAIRASVIADLAKIRRFLIDNMYLDTTQAIAADGSYNVLGEYFYAPKGGKKIGIRRDTAQVVLDYLYLAKDRSNGAHNPKNIPAMIAAMKTFLGIN